MYPGDFGPADKVFGQRDPWSPEGQFLVVREDFALTSGPNSVAKAADRR